jgi:hypothetical protein
MAKSSIVARLPGAPIYALSLPITSPTCWSVGQTPRQHTLLLLFVKFLRLSWLDIAGAVRIAPETGSLLVLREEIDSILPNPEQA